MRTKIHEIHQNQSVLSLVNLVGFWMYLQMISHVDQSIARACPFILLIVTNGCDVQFWCSALSKRIALRIAPNAVVRCRVRSSFRILAGPGFFMRFILQTPG